MANPIEVQTFLKGVDYPATKEDLVTQAEQNGASDDVLEVLNALPEDDEYDTPAEVQEALGGEEEKEDERQVEIIDEELDNKASE